MASPAMELPTMRRKRARFSPVPYFFLAPALVSIGILTLFPVLYTIYVSFTNYSLRHFLVVDVVGLKNYYNLLNPNGIFFQDFWPVFVWTVAFSLLTALFNYTAGFLLAVLLNNPRLPERAIYRTLLIVPYALPSVISIMIWQGLLNQSFGAVDSLLTSIHLPSIPWLDDPTGARAAILLVNLWLSFPFDMIVCLGALQAIPTDMYEAASIDGASPFARLRLLTLPLVFRMTAPQIVGAFSFNFMNLNIVYLLTAGGPPKIGGSGFAGSSDVLASFTYNLTLNLQRYDLSAAIGIVIFFIQAALAFLGFWLTGSFKEALT